MPLLKKVKSSNWVDSDFGFDEFVGSNSPNTTSKSRKRGRETRDNTLKANNTLKVNNTIKSRPDKSLSQRRRLTDGELWIDRHEPRLPEQLAVHPKKVEEVSQWLETQSGGILVLCGPAGVGKTATVRALAHALGMEVKEWVNPVDQVEYNNTGLVDEDRFIPNDTVTFTNKTKQFKDWLRGAKYAGLSLEGSEITNSSKIILVEDLPNYVFTKTAEFHDLLEQYVRAKRSIPLVFVISESAKAKSSVRTLFPAELVERLNMSVITFNPVAPTNLVKALTNIATLEARNGVRSFVVPDKPTLMMLAESTGGDIRAAVNALQFSCLNNTNNLSDVFDGYSSIASSKNETKSKTTSAVKKSKKTSKSSNTSELASVGGKDPTLQMFHALGKVLYAKREDGALENYQLPSHLQKHRRYPLKANPDEIIEMTTLSADAFSCFLHQNYLPFYTNLSDVVRSSEYFSQADLLLSEWGTTGKMSLTEYGGILSARATMFCNTSPAQVVGMRKLNKPQYYGAVKTEKNRLYGIQRALVTASLPTKELTTVTVPLLAKIRPPGLGVGQQQAVADVGLFPGIKYCGMRATDTLDVNDIFTETEEEVQMQISAPSGESLPPGNLEEDEDFVIEEFDD